MQNILPANLQHVTNWCKCKVCVCERDAVCLMGREAFDMTMGFLKFCKALLIWFAVSTSSPVTSQFYESCELALKLQHYTSNTTIHNSSQLN